ncbi:MAG TPA: hypothetical protein VKZ60_18595 [Chloroflexota bacterium]|nr:hypothetical protein [Chloroflexota bacterium]
MLDAQKRAAARREAPPSQEAGREPPLVALAQSCQGALAAHGFWLERYGSSLGLTWVRFRRLLRDEPTGPYTQVFLVAHDQETQQFLADDYLVHRQAVSDEAARHAAWHYANAEELPAVMGAVVRTLQQWAASPPALPPQ